MLSDCVKTARPETFFLGRVVDAGHFGALAERDVFEPPAE